MYLAVAGDQGARERVLQYHGQVDTEAKGVSGGALVFVTHHIDIRSDQMKEVVTVDSASEVACHDQWSFGKTRDIHQAETKPTPLCDKRPLGSWNLGYDQDHVQTRASLHH